MLDRIRKAGKDEGFTLIELLIVIVILGILAAIVVFAVGSTRKDSVASSCKTDFKSVELASEAYYTKYGTYAADTAHITTPIGLLKTYPSSSDYKIAYANTGVLTVQKPDGTAVGTNPNTKDGCDAL